MSDANLKDKAEEDEDAGFEDLGAETKEKKPVVTDVVEVKTAEEIKAEEDAAKAKAEEDEAARKKAEDEAPVVITKKQLDSILAELDENKSLKKTIQSLTGTVGNLSTGVADLKKTTATLEISQEDFAQLEAEFPKIGDGVKKGLGSLLKRMTGVKPAAGVGEAELKAAIFLVHDAQQHEILEAEFGEDAEGQPIWRKIVGDKDAAPTDYRKWFDTQPEAFQKKVRGSHNAHVLIAAIKKYQRDARAAEKVEADRKAAEAAKANGSGNGVDRRRAAVQPRGDGGGGPPPAKGEQTEDDGFDSVEVKKVV